MGVRISIDWFNIAGSDSSSVRVSQSGRAKSWRNLLKRAPEFSLSAVSERFELALAATRNCGAGAFAKPDRNRVRKTARQPRASSPHSENLFSVADRLSRPSDASGIRSRPRRRTPSVPPKQPRRQASRGTRWCHTVRLGVPTLKRMRTPTPSSVSRAAGGPPSRGCGPSAATSGVANRSPRQQLPGLRLHRHIGRCDRMNTTLRHVAKWSRDAVSLDDRAAPRAPSPLGTMGPGCGQ